MFPYLLEESVYSSVLVALVALMLLAQFLVYFASHFFKNPPTEPARLKAFAALSIVTPVVIILLLVVAVHQARISMLNAFSCLDPAEKEVRFVTAYCTASIQKLYGGYALVVAGLAGALYSIFWLHRLGKTGVTAVSMVVSAGAGIASIAIGLGLSLREFRLAVELTSEHYADYSELAPYYSELLKDSPSLSGPLVVGAVVAGVTGLMACWLAWRKKPVLRLRKTALASGLVVLLVGVCAIISTLGQADDVRETLPRLHDSIAEEIGFRVILVPGGPDRPGLENWRKPRSCSRAPVIVVDDGRVDIDGNHVGQYGEIIDSEDAVINALGECLIGIEMSFRQMHWFSDIVDEVRLNADRSAPGEVIGKVLATCHRSGYRRVQLITEVRSSVPTAVFGELVLTRLAWVPFTLTEGDDSEALPFKLEETYGEFAGRVDAAAGKGAVEVLVPYR